MPSTKGKSTGVQLKEANQRVEELEQQLQQVGAEAQARLAVLVENANQLETELRECRLRLSGSEVQRKALQAQLQQIIGASEGSLPSEDADAPPLEVIDGGNTD